MDTVHPCLRCGACCAAFRVSFYWAEPVPPELTVRVTPFLAAMDGTDRPEPRCVALHGELGREVRCTAYEARPSPCREFGASWEDGTPNPRCDAARARYGLPPLRPEDHPGS
jgi:Fe-S-cluster containining protein